MLRYKLTYKDQVCELYNPEDAPMDWDKLKYTFYRNPDFVGLFRRYNVKLKFVGKGKTFLQNIEETFGYNEEVTVTIEKYNSDIFQWYDFLIGIINYGNVTKGEYTYETNFENSGFEQSLMNRKAIEVAYQNTQTVDEVDAPQELNPFVEVKFRFTELDFSFVQCIYPFEAIDRIIYLITGERNRLKSSYFGKVSNGYASDGEGAYLMITKGLYFRAFATTDTNINLSLESLLSNGFFKMLNLGMNVELEEGVPYVRIEKAEYFFNQEIVLTKEDASKLIFELDDSKFFNKLTVGYSKFKQPSDDTANAVAEYNRKSTYSIAHKPFINELNLTTNLRADGIGMKLLKDTPKVEAVDAPSVDGDNDIFILDCVVNDGQIESRILDGYYSASGVYGENPYYVNIGLSPARIIKNNENRISIGLQYMNLKNLVIQNTEGLSKLVTKKIDEISEVKDGTNIQIGTLAPPYLSVWRAKFQAPIYPDEIIALESNLNGIIKVYNYIENSYFYAWINEITTDPIDKVTNWDLSVAFNVDSSIEAPHLLDMAGNAILNQLGGKILING